MRRSPHSLRRHVLAARSAVKAANAALDLAVNNLTDSGAEHLAVTVRALRYIVSCQYADKRSKGVAEAALKKIGLGP